MSRNLIFVLLLTTGVALADKEARAQQSAGAPEAQARTEPPKGETADPQPKTTGEQGQTTEAQTETDEAAKLKSAPGSKGLGMSILANEEAPKALVIVPWKTSELGNSLGVSTLLDDSRQPVDRDVFMRSLRYYEIRAETKP
jgi:hypothetical protein